MKLMVTGHRPSKLGGYSEQAFNRLVRVAGAELRRLRDENDGNLTVITGMALGWDQAVATACAHLGIPYEAYIPFVGQERVWPPRSQQRYHALLQGASQVVVVSQDLPTTKGHAAGLLLARNNAMVNTAHECLALWDGTSGGTAHAVKECEYVGIYVHNCYLRWVRTP